MEIPPLPRDLPGLSHPDTLFQEADGELQNALGEAQLYVREQGLHTLEVAGVVDLVGQCIENGNLVW